jgi:hypothetical protein
MAESGRDYIAAMRVVLNDPTNRELKLEYAKGY